jgi:hypothetical protein
LKGAKVEKHITFNSRKTAICMIAIVAIILVGIYVNFVYGNPIEQSNAEIPISTIHGTYVIDLNDQEILIGDADYVFVGYVENIAGTEYRFPATATGTNGAEVESSVPYTNYEITVLENIKGNLVLDTIPLQKMGGIAQDNSQYYVCENDYLPAVGDVAIFVAYTQSDGSLLLPGPNSNTPLEITADNSIASGVVGSISSMPTLHQSIIATDVYQTIERATKNQVQVRERERFVSIYDTGINDEELSLDDSRG